MSQYFPKPYGPFGRDINVKVDLSNYATKTDLKTCDTCGCHQFCTESKFS